MFSSTCHCRTFTFVLASISISFQLFVIPVQTLGINCRGSLLCPARRFKYPYLNMLIGIAKGTNCISDSGFNCGPINDTDIWGPGKHILCLPQEANIGGLCIFAHGNVPPLGVTGDLVERKLAELKKYGCHVCGSVPLSDDNDANTAGELTVNWVSSGACWGMCPSTHYYDPQLPGNHTLSLNSSNNGALLFPTFRSPVETS